MFHSQAWVQTKAHPAREVPLVIETLRSLWSRTGHAESWEGRLKNPLAQIDHVHHGNIEENTAPKHGSLRDYTLSPQATG
jgi:hypothetical protein